jgi:hypothetical protein
MKVSDQITELRKRLEELGFCSTIIGEVSGLKRNANRVLEFVKKRDLTMLDSQDVAAIKEQAKYVQEAIDQIWSTLGFEKP